jgi:Fe2+ transport system protein B
LFPEPLTKEEEIEALQRLANGDEEARNLLIERNLRLVAHVAKKYTNTKSEQEDELTILCNFTQENQENNLDKYQFMLLLNEGKQIFIRSIHPEQNEDEDKIIPPEQSKNKDKINLIYYLGIPIIIIIIIIVISLVIFIIKRRKKNINEIEEITSGSLIKELNQASD